MFSLPQPILSKLDDKSSEVALFTSFAREKKNYSTLFEVCLITKTTYSDQSGSSLKVMIGTATDQTDLHYSLKKAK